MGKYKQEIFELSGRRYTDCNTTLYLALSVLTLESEITFVHDKVKK